MNQFEIGKYKSEVLTDNDLSNSISSRLESHIENCGSKFPYYSQSLALVSKLKDSGIIDRLTASERHTSHNPLSHSLVTAWYASVVGEQLNGLSQAVVGYYILDTPLLTTATFTHDLGNILRASDVTGLKLHETDFRPYFKNHPYLKTNPSMDSFSFINNSHIARTVAWLLSYGFNEHAQVAAHGLYNLTEEPNVPVERLVLMIADLCIINGVGKSRFLNSIVAESVFDRVIDAYQRHGGELDEYKKHFEIMQTAKSVLSESGICIPPCADYPDWLKIDEETLTTNYARISKFFDIYHISKRKISPQ